MPPGALPPAAVHLHVRTMKKSCNLLLPAIAATLAPMIVTVSLSVALMLTAQQGNPKLIVLIALFSLVISLGHVLLLGLPAVYLLKKLGRFKAWSAGTAGFLAGCIPMGIWSWPVEYSKHPSSYSYWDGAKTVQAKIDGIPTMVGWIDYAEGIVWMGALGAIAGIAFWFVSTKCRTNSLFDTDATRRST